MLKSKHTLLTAAVGFAFGCMLQLPATQWHRGVRELGCQPAVMQDAAKLCHDTKQLLARAEGQFVPRQPHDHAAGRRHPPYGSTLKVGEGRDNLWAKTKAAFRYLLRSPPEGLRFLSQADDDTYAVVEESALTCCATVTRTPASTPGVDFKPFVPDCCSDSHRLVSLPWSPRTDVRTGVLFVYHLKPYGVIHDL
uniref:PRKCSH_1 domain-containing protein n=1 Tax=Macrostomum lignano TaxID=282301 RepID=A0A1I8JSA7_9PLAT